MDRAVPDLLTRAASLLAREASRLPSAVAAAGATAPSHALGGPKPDSAAAETPLPTGPVSGLELPTSALAGPSSAASPLRQQAHELLASLLGAFEPLSGAGASAAAAVPMAAALSTRHGRAEENVGPLGVAGLGKACPITHAAPQLPGFDRDRIRRQAHQLIETLLVTFNEATGEKGLPADDRVPLLYAAAPVQPGETARCSFRVSNEEALPADVSLYATNFVADCGYEIPSLRVGATPRRLTIAAGADGNFDVSVAVPQQAPRGKYSGLLQAMGYTYFKAVLCVEVL